MLDEIIELKRQGLNYRQIGKLLGVTRNTIAGKVHRAGLAVPSEKMRGIPKQRTVPLKPRKPTRTVPRHVPHNNPLIAPVIRAEYRRAYADKAGEGMPFAQAVLENRCLWVCGDVVRSDNTVACGCERYRRGFCAEHYAVCFIKKRAEELLL